MEEQLPHTERPGNYSQLDEVPTSTLLNWINSEDQTVPQVVNGLIPKIVPLVETITAKMKMGGRLFYLGAGTSGRLGVVDASEIPPTYGLEHGRVIGLIAGGDQAIRKAVEFAEDNFEGGWSDLQSFDVNANDVVLGIAASGRTPYVIGALEQCQKQGITTACITCNENTALEKVSDFPLVAVVGPEIVTGSTRMKAGTAQKLLLNMISTSVMIGLGRVKGNRMVDMQLANDKLVERGTRMIMQELGIEKEAAALLLKEHGSVRAAVNAAQK